MGTIYLGPTSNFLQTTLNGAITDTAGTITLTSATGFQTPGYVVIDRTDSSGSSTPNAREVVSYTGISGNNLTGCVRPADGSTARSHSDGAIVETAPTVGMWNSLATVVSSGLTGDGYLKAIASPVSIQRAELNQMYASIASIAQIFTTGRLEVSGASITGFGIYPVFASTGDYSGATLAIGGVLRAPRAGTLQWVSASTRYVVSTGSIGFDFKIRDGSVFANATIRPAIAAAGTFVSTASIATRNINQGDLLSADIATVGIDGFVRTISIQGGTS